MLLSSLGSDLLSLCNEPPLSLSVLSRISAHCNLLSVAQSGGRYGPDPVVKASATGVRAPLPEDGGWFLESDFGAVLFHC